MRRFLSLFVMLMMSAALVFAQSRVVTGTVTDDKGTPIEGASVRVKGSRTGVAADASGNYRISVNPGATLVISGVNLTPQEVAVGEQSTINVRMVTTGTELTGVTVTTALGIKRRPKELGYANTTIRGETITAGRNPNLGAALSGRVAGLNITNTSSSVGASPRITLRGNRSIRGNNQALIVLDGVPVPQNTIGYLNPNDVESITVLKGGQAATLYGDDGVNGVLVINTRKGSGKPQVSFTSTTNFEKLAYLPRFQTTHGSGSEYGHTPDENFRPFENQQYGPRYDGSLRSAGRVLQDGSHLQLPYSNIKGVREDIWDRGSTIQNDISVSGGDATSGYFLSFQDAFTKGIVTKDEFRRDAFRFNARKTYGKFTTSFDGTYALDKTKRTSTDFYFFALNSASWIPLNDLRDFRNNKFANENGYFNDYYRNPFFELENNRINQRNTYFNGNVTLNFKPFTWLDATYRIGTATTNTFGKNTTGAFVYDKYTKDSAKTFDPRYNDYNGKFIARNNINGAVSDNASFGNRINSDFILSFNKNFGDYSAKLILGNNIQVRRTKSLTVSSTSVVIPELYNVSNRSGELGGGESNTELRKVGNYADLTLGLKDFLFLHGSFRYDQNSALYTQQRKKDLYSYPYYGADVSFIVTDAIPSIKNDALGYLKLRAGWNKNGLVSLEPYSLEPEFFNGSGFPYGSSIGITVGNAFPDPSLRPEKVQTIEGGLEAQFWKNRINLDLSIYKQKVEGQVLDVALSPSTGYTSTTLNAGNVDNYGGEVELKANIFKSKDWIVDVNSNYTYNSNKVKTLFGLLERVQLNTSGSSSFIYAEKGQPFPLLKVSAYQRDSATGKIIIDENDGWPLLSGDLKSIGTTIPKHSIGIGTSITYKMLTFAANAEYRGGAVIYHDMGEDMSFTGSGAITALYGREQFIYPNSVYRDPISNKLITNTSIPVANDIAIYKGWGDYSFSRSNAAVGEGHYSSADFWKLRNISLTLNVPANWTNRVKAIKKLSLSIFGRNLKTWLPDDNWYTDPEFANTTGNGVGLSTSRNTPPVKQYGATLNVTF